MLLPEDQRNPDTATAAKEKLIPCLEHVAKEAQHEGFLVGPKFSAADISVGHSVVWSGLFGTPKEVPGLGDYLERLSGRIAFQKVYKKQ